MKKNVFITIISAFLFSNFLCEKETFCYGTVIDRVPANITLTPAQVEYNINDTIWLSANFETVLELVKSDSIKSSLTSSGSFRAIIANLDNGDSIKSGFSDFKIVEINGGLSQDGIENEAILNYEGYIHFDCDTLSCKFNIGLIPKKTGNYCIIMASGDLELYDAYLDCPVFYSFDKNRFNVSSYNRELYAQYELPKIIHLPMRKGVNTWNVEKSDAAYTFRVK